MAPADEDPDQVDCSPQPAIVSDLIPEELSTEKLPGTPHSIKRTLSDSEEDEPENKRLKPSNKKGSSGQPIRKATSSNVRRPFDDEFGDHHQFPDFTAHDGLADEHTTQAFAYLQQVRSEALSIPKVLVASAVEAEKGTIDTATNEGTCGFYKDGIYIARTYVNGATDRADGGHDSLGPDCQSTIQEKYRERLLKRYAILRRKLAQVVATLGRPGMASSWKKPPKNRHEWLYTLDREYPTAEQLAQLSVRELFRGLELCTSSLDRMGDITDFKSCWIWSLLARIPEYGDLDYSKVAIVRELGKKAVSMMSSLGKPSNLADNGDVGLSADNATEVGTPDHEAQGAPVPTTEAEDTPTDVETDKHEETPQRIQGNESKNHVDILNPPPNNDENSDMDISSDDEGADQGSMTIGVINAEFNAAKERLLAQLGGQLVSASIPDSPSPPAEPQLIPSRAEAEYQRLKTCDDTLERQTNQEEDPTETVPTAAAGPSKSGSRNVADVDPKALNTKATLDMILIIVAEPYGQKDLLWDKKGSDSS